MRVLLLFLFSSLLIFNCVHAKKHRWLPTSTSTTAPQADVENKGLKAVNESAEESNPVKDDSVASELADAVGQASNEEFLHGVVSKSVASKQSLKMAAPQIIDSSEEKGEDIIDKRPTKATSGPSLWPRKDVPLAHPGEYYRSEITRDSSEEDEKLNKKMSKATGEKEKLLDLVEVAVPTTHPKPKGNNIEVKDDLVDPYQNLRRYTFGKQADDEDLAERRHQVAHALPHTNAFILRSRREAPASKPDLAAKPDPVPKDLKETSGGMAYNVNFETGNKSTKPKPVLSSSSRSSSTSSRSYLPKIEAGMEIRKRRTPDDSDLSDHLLSHSADTNSNRSMLADLLGIGLEGPMQVAEPRENIEHVPQKMFKAIQPPIRPIVQSPVQSTSSSSSSSESADKSHQKDKSDEDNSLEQILIIAESPEKELKTQHFIKNMHKNSMKTGPIFIKNSELHFESGSMAKPKMDKTYQNPFAPRPYWMEGKPDSFHRGGPIPPFGGLPPPFSPTRGPFEAASGHAAAIGREIDEDGHLPREMHPLSAFQKEMERGEEGLWMAGRGLTLTLHLNATSLGILSMLVVLIILFKLYKMVHKKQAKHFFAPCQQKKEENNNKQIPTISHMDEIKI